MSTHKKTRRRLRNVPFRRGVVTLEYVMVLIVVFPAAYVMLRLAIKGFTSIYHFMSITLGGLNL